MLHQGSIVILAGSKKISLNLIIVQNLKTFTAVLL
jgi:hypothetical protein